MIFFWLLILLLQRKSLNIFEFSWSTQVGYIAQMKKSGKTNRYEPTGTSWENNFPDCAALFKRAGWFTFFERIIGFNPEVSYHFSQGFSKDKVTFDTLNFELTKELIAEAIGVSIYGR